MKNKIINLTMCGLLLFTATACGNGDGGSKSSKTEDFSNAKEVAIEYSAEYELETDTIWMNIPLNITYDIPKTLFKTLSDSSASFTYMHGQEIYYYEDFPIFVEKSLEGSENLKTLASAITKEKLSDKYVKLYDFGYQMQEFEVDKTEKVKIGDLNAIYFESKKIKVDGEDYSIKYIGYNFEYNGEYISVYGVTKVDATLTYEENWATDISIDMEEYLNNSLIYITSSIDTWNGDSLQELGGNAINLYDYGDDNNYFVAYSGRGSKIFTVNLHGDEDANGIFATWSFQVFEPFSLDTSGVWDGQLDTIFDITLNEKYVDCDTDDGSCYLELSNHYNWQNFTSDYNNGWIAKHEYEVLDEQDVTINGVDMKRYVIATEEDVSYSVVYTFIYDGYPYLLDFILYDTFYEDEKFETGNLTEEEKELIIAQTSVVADTCMQTIRLLTDEEIASVDHSFRVVEKYHQ